jgi:endonuclease YncB( thermonuclease family)
MNCKIEHPRFRRSRRLLFRICLILFAVAGAAVALGGRPGSAQWSALFAKAEMLQIGQSISGRASVIDGDTIEIHGERVRFNGIDAPESSQSCQAADRTSYRCGQQAAMALDGYLSQSIPVQCDFVERDRYGRFVGDCYRADGSNIQRWLVANGWAMDWPRYSHGRFSREQQSAKRARLGIWAGSIQPPWEWRANRHDTM